MPWSSLAALAETSAAVSVTVIIPSRLPRPMELRLDVA